MIKVEDGRVEFSGTIDEIEREWGILTCEFLRFHSRRTSKDIAIKELDKMYEKSKDIAFMTDDEIEKKIEEKKEELDKEIKKALDEESKECGDGLIDFLMTLAGLDKEDLGDE